MSLLEDDTLDFGEFDDLEIDQFNGAGMPLDTDQDLEKELAELDKQLKQFQGDDNKADDVAPPPQEDQPQSQETQQSKPQETQKTQEKPSQLPQPQKTASQQVLSTSETQKHEQRQHTPSGGPTTMEVMSPAGPRNVYLNPKFKDSLDLERVKAEAIALVMKQMGPQQPIQRPFQQQTRVQEPVQPAPLHWPPRNPRDHEQSRLVSQLPGFLNNKRPYGDEDREQRPTQRPRVARSPPPPMPQQQRPKPASPERAAPLTNERGLFSIRGAAARSAAASSSPATTTTSNSSMSQRSPLRPQHHTPQQLFQRHLGVASAPSPPTSPSQINHGRDNSLASRLNGRVAQPAAHLTTSLPGNQGSSITSRLGAPAAPTNVFKQHQQPHQDYISVVYANGGKSNQVVVADLAPVTTKSMLFDLDPSIKVVNLNSRARKATLLFDTVALATQFRRKFNRHMLNGYNMIVTFAQKP